MRKIILSVIAAVALTAAFYTPPAEAIGPELVRAAPYEHVVLRYGTCVVDADYGTYGAPYARIRELANSSCYVNTAVRVGASPGPVYSPWCTNFGRLVNNYPNNCSYSGFTTTAKVFGQTGLEAGVWLCYEPASGPTCKDFVVSPFV